MNHAKLILIPGRSIKQGKGISIGKDSAGYKEAVTTMQMNKEDMADLGLEDSSAVKVKAAGGEVIIQCKGADLPRGLAFIPFGPASSHLMGRETHGSGMPDSKGFEVEVEGVS